MEQLTRRSSSLHKDSCIIFRFTTVCPIDTVIILALYRTGPSWFQGAKPNEDVLFDMYDKNHDGKLDFDEFRYLIEEGITKDSR